MLIFSSNVFLRFEVVGNILYFSRHQVSFVSDNFKAVVPKFQYEIVQLTNDLKPKYTALLKKT